MDESTLSAACQRYLAAARAVPEPGNSPQVNAAALAELDEAWSALTDQEKSDCGHVEVPFHPDDFTR